MTYQRAIHWFRRDLRIADNSGFYHALRSSEEVVPLYIASDWKGEHHWTGPARQQFLCNCLESLSKNIDHLGGQLIIRQGSAVEVLEEFIKEHKIDALFFNRDPDPFGKKVEKQLQQLCSEFGVDFHGHKDVVMHDESEVLTKSNDSPYRVFTPYKNAWLKLHKPKPLPKPRKITTPKGIASDSLPSLETWGLEPTSCDLLEAGEKAARERLKNAVSNVIGNYHETRDIPSVKGTSRLSQDLRFGTISARTVFHAVHPLTKDPSSIVRKGAETYISELAWREFYMAILAHYPKVLEEEFNSDWVGLPWEKAGESFEAWKNGKTGFPIVDAGMRQLKQTGFMHNRLRMITAMFLTKDLHLDWRLGERYFMQQLLDGEIASNNGGWQWSAGTGADAAPYFRIQNPWTQSKRFDPEGKYIKTWVPELKDIDPKRLHEAPKDGNSLTKDYPAPIVDHNDERKATLEIFKAHKG